MIYSCALAETLTFIFILVLVLSGDVLYEYSALASLLELEPGHAISVTRHHNSYFSDRLTRHMMFLA